jgi:hypothetical protein
MAESYVYRSARGFRLVYDGPPPIDIPVLTVECYVKWYDLYAVYPDGSARKVPPDDYDGADVTHAWSDHVPYPPALRAIARHLRMEWDENSLDMIHGRYYREAMDLLDEDDPQDWVKHRVVKEDSDVAGGRPRRPG